MGEYVLRTTGISKKYGDVHALDKVSVEIKRGQIYGLIGLNGAGKSTFMRAVMGLISVSDGNIELFGESGEKGLRQSRRRIGQSIEMPVLYPDMTAVQNLEIQRLIGGIPNKDSIKSVLDAVGLEDTGKKKTKDFSLGMRQRLALAKALMTNPEFLILDEPANGLDPMGIIGMRELMRKLAKERGLTLLVSSHLLEELSQVATHYGIIHKGRLVRQLSAEELAAESKHYVKIITEKTAEAVALLGIHFGIKDYRVVSKTELRIFEQVEKVGEMNTLLVKNDITVTGLFAAEQKLEEYFIDLTGGTAA